MIYAGIFAIVVSAFSIWARTAGEPTIKVLEWAALAAAAAFVVLAAAA